jgi:benzoate-CoA ligase
LHAVGGTGREGVVGPVSASGLARPHAFVVPKAGEGSPPDLAEDLKAFLRTRLPGYKIPEIRFVAELPKTAAGKIKRFMLREILQEEQKEKA